MWKDCPKYWIHNANQGTAEWRQSRLGRITASDFGAVAGMSRFKTPEETLDYLTGKRVVEDNENMAHGRRFEPFVRDWYSQRYALEVKEYGLMVPKWDTHIGCSIDGEVGEDGMIEIKCPKRMYYYLAQDKKLPDWKHIPETHFAQMQGCMAITGKQWCDYLVYSDSEKRIYKERIPFHEPFWNRLYQQLRDYYTKYDNELSQVRIDPS